MPNSDADVSAHAAAPFFRHLPAYAKFLLDHKLHEFSSTIIKVSREIGMPLLRYFESMPEDELIRMGVEGNRKFLQALADDKAAEYIEENLRNWKENQLPLIQGDDIVIEDISKANFSRRKVFRDFLPFYNGGDTSFYIALMEEVDRFTLMQEERSYKTLFELKEAKIREHHYFIEKINDASPGINYVYDLLAGKIVYANHKREEFVGYSNDALAGMDPHEREGFIHPDDRVSLNEHRRGFADAADAELRTIEFRLLNKAGNYAWQRAYEAVFRRDEQNIPVEIIGMAIDVSKEKEATILLEQREQQLREAQEIAGMGSFDWDMQGPDSILSPQVLRIFEMEERANLPDFLGYIHPADRESVKQAIADAIGGSAAFECEYRYRRNGPEKVVWSRGKVVFKDGRPLRMKGTVMDVTQRHDMVKRLARSEQLHKQAQALTHLGNWSWSLSDNKVEWSDEMYRVFGLQPQSEQMTFERFAGFIHPDDRNRLRSALSTALSTLHAEDYLMRLVSQDGTIKYVEGRTEVLCDEYGKPYKLAGTCQDVTAHHLLNEQLKQNEEASSQLINNAPEAIVVIDQHSNILFWNPKAEAVFGWHEDEIKGLTLVETIIPPQYREAHIAGISLLPDNDNSQVLNTTIEIEALKKGGGQFYISLSISRSQRAGQIVYIAFIRDISEERATALKLAEQRNQLAQQNLALERSNQELTAFNYISSHDLKEPVRKIKIFGNLIAGGQQQLTAQQQDAMNRILASADHMERLIEALTVFSRTSTEARKFERVSLADVIDGIIIVLRDQITETSAVISVDPLPELSVVPFQIQQLFENVIANALKYREPGVPPAIHISAALVQGSSIADTGAVTDAEYHLISVSDNGIGFEQQYASKVFEVFQRLHSKDSYSGTGIGLAICKKIVQHHNGFITAESTPGAGTTFNIYLPATDQQAS